MITVQKYYEREWLTTEEKEDICKKTDCVCAHCGKFVYPHYGATIDHFIPLDRGGSSRKINLIPLCEDCNHTKDNKLYSIDYVPYLKPKYKKELEGYVNDYILISDTAQRSRLLAYDEYKGSVKITPPNIQYSKHKPKNHKLTVDYTIKLATWQDFDKLYAYFVKYLKRRDSLDSEDAAISNIQFWLRFGCIYYVERKNEIMLMVAMTIKHLQDQDKEVGNIPQMYVFSQYQADLSLLTIDDSIYRIATALQKENKLNYLPVNILFIKADPIHSIYSQILQYEPEQDEVEGFLDFLVYFGDATDENIQKTKNFFSKFTSETKKLIKFFNKYENDEISWMLHCVLSYDDIISSDDLRPYRLKEEIGSDNKDDN